MNKSIINNQQHIYVYKLSLLTICIDESFVHQNYGGCGNKDGLNYYGICGLGVPVDVDVL